jgi:hypothetical protein
MMECLEKLHGKGDLGTDAVHGYSFALAAMASIIPASPLGTLLHVFFTVFLFSSPCPCFICCCSPD